MDALTEQNNDLRRTLRRLKVGHRKATSTLYGTWYSTPKTVKAQSEIRNFELTANTTFQSRTGSTYGTPKSRRSLI